MNTPIRVLLQTTISPSDNDWNINRFSMLRTFLEGLRDADNNSLLAVTARDRGPLGSDDPVISKLDESEYDEVWLFAVDSGDGLTDADRDGILRFQRRGGGLMITRDHMDLGCSICSIGSVGAAHVFHTHNLAAGQTAGDPDDLGTPTILWPNYHSGANGDAQLISVEYPIHPLLSDPDSPSGAIRYLPAHPHEGAVIVPSGEPNARVIATGRSKISGAAFNLAIAFEPTASRGPALAQSTFHHFADYNWDISRGSPDFVTEVPGDSLVKIPGAMESVHRYVYNVALWLAQRHMPIRLG